MASVTTDRPIDLGRLLAETGADSGTLAADDDTGATTVTIPSLDEATLQSAVDAHDPTDPRERFREAVQDATDLDGLKAALLGTNTSVEPDVRPRGSA